MSPARTGWCYRCHCTGQVCNCLCSLTFLDCMNRLHRFTQWSCLIKIKIANSLKLCMWWPPCVSLYIYIFIFMIKYILKYTVYIYIYMCVCVRILYIWFLHVYYKHIEAHWNILKNNNAFAMKQVDRGSSEYFRVVRVVHNSPQTPLPLLLQDLRSGLGPSRVWDRVWTSQAPVATCALLDKCWICLMQATVKYVSVLDSMV